MQNVKICRGPANINAFYVTGWLSVYYGIVQNTYISNKNSVTIAL